MAEAVHEPPLERAADVLRKFATQDAAAMAFVTALRTRNLDDVLGQALQFYIVENMRMRACLARAASVTDVNDWAYIAGGT